MPQDKPILVKERSLLGHRSEISSLAISPDGKSILSGDDDGSAIVWNRFSGEATQTLSNPFHGAVSAVAWLKVRDSNENAFILGYSDGSLHLLRRNVGTGKYDFAFLAEGQGPVEDIAFNQYLWRLASVGGGSVQVWSISDTGTLTPTVNEPTAKDVIAKNVVFCDDGASVIVFYLESHEITCYTIEPWAVKWSKTLPTRIGHATFCRSDGDFIYITNLQNGVDQYRFPTFERVQSFTHPITNNKPLQVSTTSRGQWVVCGGDSGFARVFDRRTGQILQQLEHTHQSQMIQLVSTHQTDDGCVVATARSSSDACDIQIWTEHKLDRLPGELLNANGDAGQQRGRLNASLTLRILAEVLLAMFVILQGCVIAALVWFFWPSIESYMRNATATS